MKMQVAQEYVVKIERLLKHNAIDIDAKFADNVRDVLRGMVKSAQTMLQGFQELKFWLSEGFKANLLPSRLYAHIMRYIDSGIFMFSKEATHAQRN